MRSRQTSDGESSSANDHDGGAPGKRTLVQRAYGDVVQRKEDGAAPAAHKIRATRDVNLRSTPDPRADMANRIGGLWKGQEAELIRHEGDWCVIRWGGSQAYVNQHYVEDVGAAAGHAANAPAPANAAPPPPVAEHAGPAANAPAPAANAPAPNAAPSHGGDHAAPTNAAPSAPAPNAAPSHGGDHAAPTNAAPSAPAPAPAPAPTNAAPQAAPQHAAPAQQAAAPAGGASPRGAAGDPLGHAEIIALAHATPDPHAQALAAELAAAGEYFVAHPPGPKDNHWEQPPEVRTVLLQKIASLREKTAALDTTSIEAGRRAQLKAGFYTAIQDLQPFYHQMSMDIVADQAVDTTCNITALAMSLESLGKSAKDFTGDKAKVLAAAQWYQQWKQQVLANEKIKVNGKEIGAWDFIKGHQRFGKDGDTGYAGRNQADVSSLDKIYALRFPDFMQLVVMAHFMSDASPHAAGAARGKAVSSLVSQDKLALFAETYFGSKVDRRSYGGAGEEALASYGKEHRGDVEHGKGRGDDSGLDKQVGLDAYAHKITAQVSPELAAGNAVIMCVYNHFTRLQAIKKDGVIIDDPGSWSRHDLFVSWRDVRAMGGFYNWLVVHP